MTKKTTHKTRESWLRAMAEMLYKKVITMKVIKTLPLQIIKGQPLEGSGMKRTPLSKIQFSCAYSPNMRVGQILRSNVVDAKVRAIGQCFYPRQVRDEDGKVIASFDTNIFITPKENNPVEVTAILLHELIHTVTQGHGHKGSFKTLCESVGLVLTPGGKGHTSALPELEKKLKGLVKEVGKYPHKKWVPSNQYKKQTTRQFKMTSLSVMCDPSNYKNSWEPTAYSCRMSRQALSAGFPMDPKGRPMYLEITAGQLESLVMHPVSHDEWVENTINLPSGGRGLTEDQYKLTQGGPVDLIAPKINNILTRDENAVMFAVACRAERWATEGIDENISYFLVKEIVEDLGWDREKVVTVVNSLKDHDMIRQIDPSNLGVPKNLHHIHLTKEDDPAYDVMKSFQGLDRTGPNPFTVGSGASDPCPPGPKGKQQKNKSGLVIARQVWRVLFSGQSWVWDHAPFAMCCTPVGMSAEWCKSDADIIYNGGFMCEEHYNEGREFEQDQQAYFDEMVRPELQWKRAERLENENILESLGPCEGGPVDGKDWIQELNEKEV